MPLAAKPALLCLASVSNAGRAKLHFAPVISAPKDSAMTETIPRNTAPVVPVCIICQRWERTPYAKRYTTPTTVQDTETAIVLGYWIASRHPADVVPRLCERHGTIVVQLDAIEAARVAEKEVQPPPDNPQRREFQARADAIAKRLSEPAVISAPPLPPLALAPELLGVLPSQLLPDPPSGPVNTPLSELDEPGEGTAAPSGKASFPCPLCQKTVVGGQVHYC